MADPRALTAKLLEVLPVAPDAVKRDAITFLPEVATEEDHEVGADSVCVNWSRDLEAAAHPTAFPAAFPAAPSRPPFCHAPSLVHRSAPHRGRRTCCAR